jgi:hypothetical protein
MDDVGLQNKKRKTDEGKIGRGIVGGLARKKVLQ